MADGENTFGKVTVAWLTAGKPDNHFMLCYDSLRDYDTRRANGRPLISTRLPCVSNSGGLTDSRNVVVRGFLDGTDDDWLLWLDDDMGFPPDLLDRFLAVADPVARPIVGALAFCQVTVGSHGMDALGCPVDGYAWAPTIYQFARTDSPILQAVIDYPRDALIECAATGSACIIIHRSVLERMREEFDGPHHWYSRPIVEVTLPDGTVERREFGEDTTFCLRARMCGFPIHVDTSIKTSHRKDIYLTEETVAHLQKMPRPGSGLPSIPTDGPALPNRASRRRKRAFR